jgi:septum site-determining protein MinD
MLTANLGIALGTLGKKVTILDADLAMANLALVLGMYRVESSLLDALRGKADISDVLHENYGIKIVPMGVRFEEVYEVLSKIKPEQVEATVNELLRQTEFLLIDAAAGIQDSTITSISAAREMLLVCNPTYTSLVDAHKVARYANLLDCWTRGLVVNRMGKRTDLTPSEIETFMGRTLGEVPILAEIPEDPKVQEAEREGVPVVVYEPDCDASIAINELAKVVAGEGDLPYIPFRPQEVRETTKRLIRAFTGRQVG